MGKREHLPFWDRVNKILRANKITQKNFAASIDLNYNTFKFWISYGYYPDAKTAYDIAVALGVTSEYLVAGKETQIILDERKRIFLREKAVRDIMKFTKKIETKILMIG